MRQWIRIVLFSILFLAHSYGADRFVSFVGAAPLAGVVASSPQPTKAVRSERRSPLSISSEEMTVKGIEDKVIFKGSVVIQRDDVTIRAGRAEVFLADSGKDHGKEAGPSFSAHEGKEIARIELTQNVDLTQGNRMVSAQRGIYDAYREEVFFTGEPEMREEGYHVKGVAITLSLKEKRSIVEGSQLTIQ